MWNASRDQPPDQRYDLLGFVLALVLQLKTEVDNGKSWCARKTSCTIKVHSLIIIDELIELSQSHSEVFAVLVLGVVTDRYTDILFDTLLNIQ